VSRWRSWAGVLAVNLIVLIAVLAAAEIALAWLLNHPTRIPGFLESPLREYYKAFDVRIIQYQPQCGRYDPDLFYTLLPGGCAFENREFSLEVKVNSAGLRDDDASLNAPQIIVVGDSHAMGWGVDRQNALPWLIERHTGRRVLTAAVSSYGTAREMALLNRLDRSNLQYLIVQYSDNDRFENLAAMNAGRLNTSSREEYDRAVAKHRRETAYYPGKHVHGLLRLVNRRVKSLFEARPPTADPEAEAEAFLWCVEHIGPDLSGVRIVVLEINDWAANDDRFVEALRRKKSAPDRPEYVRNMVVLDVSQTIGPDVYYTLDGHMRPPGHRAAARAVLDAVAINPDSPPESP
jgi:hypothetical protein